MAGRSSTGLRRISAKKATSSHDDIKFGAIGNSFRSATRLGPRPILFLLYTANLLQLVKRYLTPHAYADDTQIYGYCQPSDAGSLIQQVSVCIDEVSAWMKANRLQLNRAKTEVL